jgi:hypothetical protein
MGFDARDTLFNDNASEICGRRRRRDIIRLEILRDT